MRLALRFVVDFLGSGHVNTTKILGAYHEQGRYTISVHEFLRALLYGDHRYYDPEPPPIANVLRITRPDGREHFPAHRRRPLTDRPGLQSRVLPPVPGQAVGGHTAGREFLEMA